MPFAAPATLLAGVGTLPDRLRLGRLLMRYALTSPARLLTRAETSAVDELRRAGLSTRIIDELLRPVLSGVLADPDLETSNHVVAMILRSFARGRIGVPAAGMAALPRAVAGPLPPDRLRLATDVTAIEPGLVRTRDTDLRCRWIIVATDPPAAARRGQSGGTGLRPPGQHLIATSVVGRETPPETVVRAELARLYQTSTTGWCHLRTVAVVGALPAAVPPRGTVRAPAQVSSGIFVAGDHRDSPSIQGALASGWRVAGAVLRRRS